MPQDQTTFEFPDEKEVSVEDKKDEVKAKAEADEVNIEVVDDTPEKDKGRSSLADAKMLKPADVTEDELSRYTDVRLKDRLERLGRGYHDERVAKESAMREREEAVKIAQSVVEENKRLQGSLATNQTALLEQAKKVAASEVEDAKREYKQAYETGDTDGLVAAQEKLTGAKIKADKIQSFRPPAVQKAEPVVQTAQVVKQAPQMDAKTREWQEQNSWFGDNRKMTAYALSLHQELVDSGVSASSEEYYDTINTDMRKRFPESFDEEPAEAKSSQRTKSNVVAPASRSTAARTIVLTQSQVNLAKRLGVPLELYARKVAEGNRK